jgi:hypothetical protein
MAQRVATAKLLPAALIGGVVGAVLNVALFFVLAPLLSATPIIVQPSPDMAAMELTFVPVAIFSVLPAFVAAGLLWLLGRFTAQPYTIFRIVAVVGLVLSFGPFITTPFSAQQVIVLGLMHVVSAITIAGALDRRTRA